MPSYMVHKLIVHEITATNFTELDVIPDAYINKWLFMPHFGTGLDPHA